MQVPKLVDYPNMTIVILHLSLVYFCCMYIIDGDVL